MDSKSIRPRLCGDWKETDIEQIKQCESQQKQLRHFAQNNQRFTDEERSALAIGTFGEFEDYWGRMMDNKITFDRSHERGIGRATKNATDFAAEAYTVVKNFNPLVEMIKDFGAPFGGMALGTLCFVLVVAKNRADTEDQIRSTILDIRDRLPGFQMYQHVHTGDSALEQHLQSKIVASYKSFTEFSMEASRFYSQRGIVRWMKALVGTDELETSSMAVRKTIVDVRRVCEELVHQNMHEIKIQNQELVETGREHTKKIDELQATLQTGKLVELRTALRLEHNLQQDQRQMLALRQQGVAAEYDDKSAVERIERSREFVEWLGSSTSQVLVLCGINDDSRATHCWVSPVALKLISDQTSRDAPRDAAAPNICVFHILSLRDEDNTFSYVTRSLIYQVLLSGKKSLGSDKEADRLDGAMAAYSRLVGKPSPSHEEEILGRILVQSLELFDQGTTVWIVIDRADQCRASRASGMSGTRHKERRALLRTLVRAVENSKIILKILVVVSTTHWDFEKHSDDFGQKKDESLVITRLEESDD
ncbi:hypothetical protein PspLS_03327 [Pyricularia sp. CBS 133598]|nr:hypothetical protein PspLS_03327 [Pyricularia sp. CBS 133598]